MHGLVFVVAADSMSLVMVVMLMLLVMVVMLMLLVMVVMLLVLVNNFWLVPLLLLLKLWLLSWTVDAQGSSYRAIAFSISIMESYQHSLY